MTNRLVSAFLAFIFSITATVPSVNAASGDAHTLFAVLRPNANGDWYIQTDSSHARKGIDTYIDQYTTGIRIFTCCVAVFTKAGSISVQSDDGFGDANVTATVNGLGYNNATIQVRVNGAVIDPKDICSYVTSCGSNGNFFITMQMVE